jgi:hypothetical protein
VREWKEIRRTSEEASGRRKNKLKTFSICIFNKIFSFLEVPPG